MLNLIIFILIYGVIFGLIEWIVMRKLHIKKKWFKRSDVNKAHSIGKWLILLVGILGMVIVGIITFSTYTYNILFVYYPLWMSFFLQSGFSAFMQYKYDKASKEYIISIIDVIAIAGLLIVFPYVMPFFVVQ